MLHDRNADYILTYSGKKLSVFNPQPEQICIEDIAIGLSHKYRFGGQTYHPYTVAEHSMRVSVLLQSHPVEVQLAALLHDASEAYMSDMPTPYKLEMPDYRKIETILMFAIFKRFKMSVSWTDERIKRADNEEFEHESQLLNDERINPKSFLRENIAELFIRDFNFLMQNRNN